MLDIKWIVSNPEKADKLFAKRGIKPIAKNLSNLSKLRSDSLGNLQKLLEKRNSISKKIANLDNQLEKKNLVKEVKILKKEISKLQEKTNVNNKKLYNELAELPNFLDDDVPEGNSDKHNQELRKFGEIKKFDFKTLDHVSIGEKLQLLDFETSSKVSGSRFVYLKGNLAMLERALGTFMLDINTIEGKFEEIHSPLLVNNKSLFGTGQLPKFDSDIFKTRENFWLIPTSEVTLVNLVRDQILEEKKLPIRYTCLSPCFRSEAGAAGKDTRGLKRQHQFNKVELVSITTPEKSNTEHEYILSIAEKILKKLKLHYRICQLCSGEVGFASKKTYDIEAWIPSQKNYMEISSISNCGDFQARRINARFKKDKNINKYVHTLNGSSLAVGRTMIAILENYQNKDGTVTIPDVLKKYMNNQERL